MLMDDIVDYMTSQGGGAWTPGTNLFAGFMPPAPDAATAIYETGGMAPIKAMGAGPNTSVVEQPRVQVVVRSTAMDYATARSTAHAAFKLLDGMPSRTINGVAYKWAAAVQSPFTMGRDEDNRVLIAVNFDVVKEVSA